MATKSTTAPQQVGRPQPQTTKEQGGGPFIRYTQPGNLPQYIFTGAFGGFCQQPLVARPGYYRDFRLLWSGINGTSTGTSSGNANGDNPYNVASLIQFKDPFGTLIFSLPSYEAFLVHQFSGGAGCGLASQALPANLPSFNALVTASGAGSGNFQWALTLPLEFAKGVGTAPGANAALQPTLTININTSTGSTGFYNVAPTTLPSVQIDVESDFYWLPEGTDVAPPALGTSRQWILQQGNPVITSGGNQRIAFPRLGGFLDTLILELRDSTFTRQASFPTGGATIGATARLVLYIDGVPIDDNPFWKLQDDAFIYFRGNALPTGVYTYTRKTSLNQNIEGLLDTGEATLSSNPGTLIEVQGQPWGTAGTFPIVLNVVVGQIVPRGRMVQGLPEI